VVDEALTLLEETGRWRARDVSYMEGTWDRLCSELPSFEKADYRAQDDAPPNPYMQSVVRLPRTKMEGPVPVGVVSNTYTLAQHRKVAEKCLEGIRGAGVEPRALRCQIGLTELGEWMNLRIYFPESFDHLPQDGEKLGLRLECFNSVDGSSRLVLLLGWLRSVCANGLVIGETKAELRDVHDQHMDLERIPRLICSGMDLVKQDRERLMKWERSGVTSDQISSWADGGLAKSWGKKAACRAFHICTSGFDVEYLDPFAKGEPTVKPVKPVRRVPGAPNLVRNLYDVSQALSWIASSRLSSDERVQWQSQIPGLVQQLQATGV
jgi:hypothetical protein